jgi:hypothetical protein
MPRGVVLDVDDSTIRSMWASDMTVVDIARELGVSRSYVEKRKAKLGLSRRSNAMKMDARQEALLREMWEEHTNANIAEALGISGNGKAVAKLAQRLGLPSKRVTVRGDDFAEDVLRLHEKGLTPTRIAAVIGSIGVTAVQGVLARRGITPHSGARGAAQTKGQPKPCPTCYAAMALGVNGYACARHGTPTRQ